MSKQKKGSGMQTKPIGMKAPATLPGIKDGEPEWHWNGKSLLTTDEVSKITGRSASMLAKDRFYRQGIPYVKIGRTVRYKPADVVAYIESRRVSTHAINA